MRFSIIIPFRNAAATLPRCLEAVVAQTSTDWELILVDNASTDNSRAVADAFVASHGQYPIRVVTEAVPGAAAARNAGARLASGSWLAFTDSDCVPQPDWLRDMGATMEADPEPVAFAGCILPVPADSLVGRFLGLYTLPPYDRNQTLREYTLTDGGFPTANFVVRREWFQKVGGFDPSIYIYGEDHELCRVLYAAGGAIAQRTDARVLHIHRSSWKGFIRQTFGFGRSHALMLRRLPAGRLIWDWPLGRLNRSVPNVRLWVDLNQADKKMWAAMLLAFCWWPLWGLPLAYVFYLAWGVRRRAIQRYGRMGGIEVLGCTGLLLVKSVVMSSGRWAGSLWYRVVCF